MKIAMATVVSLLLLLKTPRSPLLDNICIHKAMQLIYNYFFTIEKLRLLITAETLPSCSGVGL